MKAQLSSKNTRLDVYVEDKDDSLQMGDLTENIFLNVKAADKTDDEDLAAFLRYVNGQKSDSSFTKKLDEEATRIKNNDDWRLKAMTLDMEIQDMKNRIAKREREKGKQEGKQEGKHESKIEIAKKMLDGGMDIDKIVLFTDLTKDEVSALV